MVKFSSKLKTGTVVILLLIFLLSLNLTNFSKEVKNFFYLISSPFQKKLLAMGESTSDFLSGILEINIFKNQIEKLYLKNQELLSEIINLKNLKKENEALREALKIGLEKEFQLEAVNLISKDISQDVALIDRGEIDGISRGMPVITPQKVLFGTVSEVYKNFSNVTLITNEKSSFDAKIVDKEIYGVAKGKGNLKLSLEFLPKEKIISSGDLIETSVLGGVYPKGLLVGEIKEVKKTDVEPLQTAEISAGFNFKKLDILFIIKSF